MTAPIPKEEITGLVLAGGRGSRMGGVDKGLVPLHGETLAARALRRLAPQVGPVLLNANRHIEAYQALGEAFGAPVWPDALPDHPGPLAGFLAGLEHCLTPYLVTVPCDAPSFPLDLVRRLAEALATDQSDLAFATTLNADGSEQTQPVFCLMRVELHTDLREALSRGERKIERWARAQFHSAVLFSAADTFLNVNTFQALEKVHREG